MLPKEERIEKMFNFLQKHYSNVFNKIFVNDSVFYDLLDFIDCSFQEFTYYYEVYEVNEKLYFVTNK